MIKPLNAKSPEEYINLIDEPRKSEIKFLDQLIRKTLPEFKPYIQSGMLGYGKYHYKYASGREGDWSVVSLASQKNYISLYVTCTKDGEHLAETYKEKLPKTSIGRSCIRFKKLEDIDVEVVTELLLEARKYAPALS